MIKRIQRFFHFIGHVVFDNDCAVTVNDDQTLSCKTCGRDVSMRGAK